MSTIFQALLAFFFTVVLGTWVTHVWQRRSLKENRHYENSKRRYDLMLQTTKDLTEDLSKRIYALQRLVLNYNGVGMPAAMQHHLACVISWNEKLMSFEIALKSYFEHVHASDLENIQNEMAKLSNIISSGIQNQSLNTAAAWSSVVNIRRSAFVLVREMVEEAKLLDRQIHFGVRLTYDRYSIERWSTKDLIKSLFAGRVEGQSVGRSASDFGLPVSAWEARLGVNE